MAGKRQKSEAQKKLEGTNRKDRAPKVKAQKIDSTNVPVPHWLDEKGKWAFKELVKICGEEFGIAERIDRYALALLCDAYSDYRELRDDIREKGRTNTLKRFDRNGKELGEKTTVRPEAILLDAAWKRVKSMLAEFAMTPLSRSRFEINREKENDPIQEFIKRLCYL